MVLKNLSQRIKKVKASLEKAKAKAHGMTVPELRAHLAKRKVEKRAFKAELRKKEEAERQKFEKWEIEQKYKRKRKAVKSGKAMGALGVLELLGGKPQKGVADPFSFFGEPKKPRKKKRKKKKRR